eukprot:scaffold174518_cov31-Tisochrysis_lutea.AAC.5
MEVREEWWVQSLEEAMGGVRHTYYHPTTAKCVRVLVMDSLGATCACVCGRPGRQGFGQARSRRKHSWHHRFCCSLFERVFAAFNHITGYISDVQQQPITAHNERNSSIKILGCGMPLAKL